MNSADIERDALRAGWSPEMAKYIASNVSRQTPHPNRMAERLESLYRMAATPPKRRPLVAPRTSGKAPTTKAERIDALVYLYGGPQSLAVDLKRCAAPSSQVHDWLQAATGHAGHITAGGVENVRLRAYAYDRGTQK